MKIASVVDALSSSNETGLEYSLVHTGQHYDKALSEVFFNQLGLPKPDVNFGVGSASHAKQTAEIMVAFEAYLAEKSTDCIVVVGDVNSTMACTLVGAKLGVPVAHVEAGLESGDRSMPEEINRLATDALADYMFCTTTQAVKNLERRGRFPQHIFLVGNTMIDTLIRHQEQSREPKSWSALGLQAEKYALCTLHRPSNVDDIRKLEEMLSAIVAEANVPVIFPVHPRTKEKLSETIRSLTGFFLEKPLSYLEFLYLMRFAQYVITDSGGIQEETTYLGVPCLTLRENTERPETVEIGTNEIVGTDATRISDAIRRVQSGEWKHGRVPDLWDGKAGIRIVERLARLLNAS